MKNSDWQKYATICVCLETIGEADKPFVIFLFLLNGVVKSPNMTRSYSICRVVPSLPLSTPYGFFINFLKISQYQRDLGHRIVILTYGPRYRYVEIDGMKVYYIRSSGRFGSFLSSQQRLRSLVKKIDAERSFDVIHSHASSSLLMARLKVGIPHIIQIHGVPVLAFDKRLRNNNRMHEAGFTKQFLYDIRSDLLLHLFLGGVDAVTTNYRYLTKVITSRYGLDARKVFTVYQGVDSTFRRYPEERYRIRGKFGLSEKDLLVLFVGRLEYGKGVFQLLETLQILSKRMSRYRKKLKFVIVGRGRKEEVLKKRIASSNLRENTCHIPYVPYEVLPQYYSSADVTMVPTLFLGISKVFLESLACETPAIGTNCQDNRFVCQEFSRYCLANSYNPSDLADKAWFLWKNRDLAREIGQKLGRRVREFFTWHRCAQDLDNIYSHVLNNSLCM